MDYIQFLWNSTNHHGVHSPFVFSLVTQCFYDKKFHDFYKKIPSEKINLSRKTQKLFLRLMYYFSVKNALCFTDDLERKNFFHRVVSSEKKSELDCIISDKSIDYQELNSISKQLKNNGFLLLFSPYESYEKKVFWKNIQKSSQFSVTIDTFSVALAFVRKEQVKQNFNIRL